MTPDRLARAAEVTGTSNPSPLLNDVPLELIERELERRWLAGHAEELRAKGDLPGEVEVDLSELPWDEE